MSPARRGPEGFVDDAQLQRLLALSAEPRRIADRFELGAVIGEGGMGVVYEAWDREGERSVALKLLRQATAADDAAQARFEREASALSLLSHPGIVAHVAHGRSADGECYLAMERLVGLTLAERLAQGPLSSDDATRVGQGVAAALAAAHAHGLVHRDLKPANIFLEQSASLSIKLLDFGLARAAHALAVTHSGALVGTPGYLAPEQVRGGAAPDARGDLFALGAVLFECLTGRAPFAAADTEGVLLESLLGQPPAVRELAPGVPPALEALIARLLAKEASRRPGTAAEVERELGALLAASRANTSPALPGAHAEPGSLIAGKYRVSRALGSGGMGIVLLARHEALERNVAIKLLRATEDAPSADGMARLTREARAASRLESEHSARVLDVGTLDDGAPFIVMEYLSGKDLAQLLREQARLPVAVAVDYVLQAASAIAEAHALGIVHRDLKPSNLFLTARRDGSPLIKVLDFGISKLSPASDAAAATSADASLTGPGAILGSPLYMSPEQLHDPKSVDARTDIWSLGVVLHELLTGRPPFQADSFLAIGAKIAAAEPADLRASCPEAPEALAAVVRRCLEKDPARRFASVAELARALERDAPAESRHEPSTRAPQRRRALVLGVVAAGALIAAALAARRSPVTEPQAASPVLTAAPTPPPPTVVAAEPPPTVVAPPSPPAEIELAPRPPAHQPARAAAPPRARLRRATPPLTGTKTPPAPDALDPMNPALLER
ncbi:MAG TPA: serine/threonine-protein kinase [Polyangiaceae bacterium]|nr:serine/threonine-protein kinase [Polyangiaceae bacterium]